MKVHLSTSINQSLRKSVDVHVQCTYGWSYFFKPAVVPTCMYYSTCTNLQM